MVQKMRALKISISYKTVLQLFEHTILWTYCMFVYILLVALMVLVQMF